MSRSRRPSRALRRAITFLAFLSACTTFGCSVLDLANPPTFDLNDDDRACRVDDDCAGVEIVNSRGTLIADSDPDGDGPLPACLEVGVGCNANRGVCEAQVTVRDADGDGAYDPTCRGYSFPPFLEDCDDSDPNITARDADGDGQVSDRCTRDPGEDCDDQQNSVFSGASVETCDGVISNCDMWVDGVSPLRAGEDVDGDGFASPDADCEAPRVGMSGYPKTDCDDTNRFVFPGAAEVCDGFINDCNAGSGPRAGEDDDGDGFGALTGACVDSEAFPKTDCDDTNPATYPGAPEICDGITNDCNMPRGPRSVEDNDGDGYASYDAPCLPGPIPYGECVDGGDDDPTTRFCPFLEKVPGLDIAFAGVSSIAFLDLTGDGRGDIVAGSASNTALRVYTRQGDGDYLTATIPGFTAATRALRVGPLFDDPLASGDDDVLDLIVLNASAGNATALCNVQALTAPTVYTAVTLAGARDGAVARVSDTVRALGVISPLAGQLHLARPSRTDINDPRCAGITFSTDILAMGSVSPTAIAAGRLLDRASDVDDLIVTTTTGDVFLFANDPLAAGGFAMVATPIASGLTGALSAVTGDFDFDGRVDVVVGTSTGTFALMNTTGAATGFEVVALSGSPGDVVSVHARDINLDGQDDLVLVSFAEDSVEWWELVDGAWVRHNLVSDFNGASAAVTGDVDDDGDIDVIGVASDAEIVTWWTTEIASNTSFDRSAVDRAFDGGNAVVAADLNGDGRPDIIGRGDQLLSWWAVSGTQAAPVYTETNIGAVSGGHGLAAHDMNGDGRVDVVVSDANGVRLMLNGGVGAASTWTTLAEGSGLGAAAPSNVVDLALADLTGDGVPDLVTLTATSVLLWTSSGGATPSFTSTSVATVIGATGLALGDTNGDGLIDIVVSVTGTPGLQVFSRSSLSASFTEAHTIPDAPPASDVVVGDVNGDGIDEIFSGWRLLNSMVAYWSWEGTGYQRHVLSTAPDSTWTHRVLLADVDSDGDLDLLVAFGAVVAVRWFENLNGTDAGWIPHTVTSVGGVAGSFAVGDFDMDEDLDVVVPHTGDSQVVLYKNDSVAWWRPRGR